MSLTAITETRTSPNRVGIIGDEFVHVGHHRERLFEIIIFNMNELARRHSLDMYIAQSCLCSAVAEDWQ